MEKCDWAKVSSTMELYHDQVWGVPIYDDRLLFRKLVLDINQAGLSWQTILNKSDAFDLAFDSFDIDTVAEYDQNKIEELLKNKEIIRNRRKIEAAIHNAQIVKKIQKEFGSFSDYLWKFVDYKPLDTQQYKNVPIPATSELSDAASQDMKKQGFKFIGSTIIYAYFQAVGIINDHVVECYRHDELQSKNNS
ncbi:DNA-3-methyladenine glycosylase I [Enterococcus sp. BWB1-3]|uniref:DNA-3-methyladenine glycosylase I n=1 Tax=unclassified Enterococcus TaxID=2608891 RepID=UPI001923B344|nr:MULTISPECIES: DNA-3-methyladenine glycosylase I [unclassified Enterococcus]MBL1228581.1 DNA-3-methyladenine glycosylase I [Enterococcus sp. BWB1-3]MCB5950587.1 DNA-3-methyladenine glycosylase I [Enterococcus sp. BWT-B8]MCB5955912.1 DNA-3-methyladenine glycosylase I [Enterococcus sp. CWB-B31]